MNVAQTPFRVIVSIYGVKKPWSREILIACLAVWNCKKKKKSCLKYDTKK